MLVLSRKVGERIWVGDDIVVEVVAIRGDNVRIGIHAPPGVPIDREEVRRDKNWCRETFDGADVAVEPERR